MARLWKLYPWAVASLAILCLTLQALDARGGDQPFRGEIAMEMPAYWAEGGTIVLDISDGDLWTNTAIGIGLPTGDEPALVFQSYDTSERILELLANGKILWRGREVVQDSVLVAALRDVVYANRRSPCGEK